MTNRSSLLDALGIDRDDPAVRGAIEDARDHSEVIEHLTKLRIKRGLSQQQVAERMGTTQSRVSSFERIGGDPRLSTLQRYARAVDVRLCVGTVPVPVGWERVDTAHIGSVIPMRVRDEVPAGHWQPAHVDEHGAVSA